MLAALAAPTLLLVLVVLGCGFSLRFCRSRFTRT